MASDRSCTRNRLMPVGVRLPTSREFTRRPYSARCLHGSVSLLATGFHSERRSGAVSARLHRFRPARHDRPTPQQVLPCGESAPRHGGFIDRHRLFAHDSPPLPHVRRSVSPPQRCLCARHANGTSHAPADSTFPFPVSAAPSAAEPLHPSFSLSFPCPKSFSRGCC